MNTKQVFVFFIAVDEVFMSDVEYGEYAYFQPLSWQLKQTGWNRSVIG